MFKVIEKLNNAVLSKDDVVFGGIDPDIATFCSNDIGFDDINLNDINLDDNSSND